jgi:hypothetical protein
MEEFKRMILKVSDVENDVATIPSTNDHTDGSWLNTDIYEGELFLNVVNNILQTRTETGIVTLYDGAGSSVNWGDILGTLSDQTDLQDALDDKINYSDFTTHSILVKQSGGSNPTSLSVGNNTLIGRKSGGGSNIEDLSVTEVKELLGDDTLIETVVASVPTLYLGLSDVNKNIENSEDLIVSILPSYIENIPIGSQFFFTKKAESITFELYDSSIILNSVDDLREMGRINCGATLLKIGENEWNLIGELV